MGVRKHGDPGIAIVILGGGNPGGNNGGLIVNFFKIRTGLNAGVGGNPKDRNQEGKEKQKSLQHAFIHHSLNITKITGFGYLKNLTPPQAVVPGC
jgi:hypothetical protein